MSHSGRLDLTCNQAGLALTVSSTLTASTKEFVNLSGEMGKRTRGLGISLYSEN